MVAAVISSWPSIQYYSVKCMVGAKSWQLQQDDLLNRDADVASHVLAQHATALVQYREKYLENGTEKRL